MLRCRCIAVLKGAAAIGHRPNRHARRRAWQPGEAAKARAGSTLQPPEAAPGQRQRFWRQRQRVAWPPLRPEPVAAFSSFSSRRSASRHGMPPSQSSRCLRLAIPEKRQRMLFAGGFTAVARKKMLLAHQTQQPEPTPRRYATAVRRYAAGS